MDPSLVERVHETFRACFGAQTAGVAFAPGRVNLIGEHTDYNEGFVLPMAIDRGVAVAFAPRGDHILRAHAKAFGETRETPLDGLVPRGMKGWTAYVAGVAWALGSAGYRIKGADLAIEADLPIGSGLSSSAALETAVARALCATAGVEWDGVPMARLCQRAENEFVGVTCGIMDQFAATLSQEGCALLLDCRSLAIEPVPIPDAAAVVVMDTAAPRALAGSGYNDRRAACERAVTAIRAVAPAVRSLRDVDGALLEACRHRMDPVDWRRAEHVVAEMRRPLAMAEALRRGDLAETGHLMNDSHASLRNLYEVSSRELDLITDIARAHPACHGARMTGAGFGGCAVALVRREAAPAFIETVEGAYRARSGLPGSLFLVRPEDGAHLVRPRSKSV